MTNSDYFQIHAHGKDGYSIDIACYKEDGTSDFEAIAQCIKMLGFELDEEQEKGNFSVNPRGNVSECFYK